MKYAIYILSILIIGSLLLFIFWESDTLISGRTERYHWLVHAYFILPAIFIINVIRTLFTYVLFKYLSVFRVLPYVMNALTLYLLLNFGGSDEVTGIVVIISMLAFIAVEILVINEVKRNKQYGMIL